MNPLEITKVTDSKKPSKLLFETTILKIIKNYKILRTYANFCLEKNKFLNTKKIFYRFLNFSKNINSMAVCLITIRKLMNSLSTKKLTLNNLVYIKFFRMHKLTIVFLDQIKKIISHKKKEKFFSLIKFSIKSGEVEIFLWILEQFWLENFFLKEDKLNANYINSFVFIEQKNKNFFFYKLRNFFQVRAYRSGFKKNFSWFQKKNGQLNIHKNKIKINLKIFLKNNLNPIKKLVKKKTSNDILFKMECLLSSKNIKKVFFSFIDNYISFSYNILKKTQKKRKKNFFFFEKFSLNFENFKKKNRKMVLKKNQIYIKSFFLKKYSKVFSLNKIKDCISFIVFSDFSSILPNSLFYFYYEREKKMRLYNKIFAGKIIKKRRLFVNERVS